MDSKRFLLAVVLMIAVIVGTNLLFPPAPRPVPQAEPPLTEAPAAEAPAVEAPPAPAPEAEAAAVGGVAPAAAAAIPAADTVLVASPLYRYGFSTAGGSVVSAQLLRYESFTAPGPVQLVGADAPPLVRYGVRVGERTIDLGQAVFSVEGPEQVSLAEGGAPQSLRLAHRDPATGLAVRLEYTFRPDEYVVDVRGSVAGVPAGGAPQLVVRMGPTLASNEADPKEDGRALAYVVNGTRQGISSYRLTDVDVQRVEEGPLLWVALKNKYFLVAAQRAPEAGLPFGGLIASPVLQPNAADLAATLPLAGDGTFAFRLYMGPQESERLAALGDGLEDVNPYGWRVFRPIIRPLGHAITWALVSMYRALDVSYGWVLILFGFLVRLALWPLNARAMRAQMKNMALQPRMQEIQAKYKNDPERLQKEMIRLYREEGFNPFGGCLPMLIPFPVLITLYFVFLNTIEFRGVEFLWLPDLSRPDPLYVIPILLGASMFLMQWISARVTPPNPQMKMMMWFMPVFMVVIFLNLASGLNLYYLAQNVASIPQQLQLARERQRQQTRR